MLAQVAAAGHPAPGPWPAELRHSCRHTLARLYARPIGARLVGARRSR